MRQSRDDATLHYQRGAECLAKGDAEGAVRHLRRAVEKTPGYAWAHQNLGQAYRMLGKAGAAERAYRMALALDPDYVAALTNLGSLLGETERYDEAIDLLKRALTLAPDVPVVRDTYAAALRARAAIAFRGGRYESAAGDLDGALAVLPNDADALIMFAESLRALLRYDAAIKVFQEAVKIRSDAKTWSGLAAALRDGGRFKAAVEAARQAIAVDPSHANAHAILGTIHHEMGRIDDAVENCRHAVDLDPASPALHSTLLWALCFKNDLGAVEMVAEHRKFDEKFCRSLRDNTPHENARDAGRRLKIGWVSPDFCRHPSGHFVLPAIRHHDRDAFEVFCYSATPREDDVTAAFRSAADQWVDIRGLRDEAVAQRIRADRIDILMDCAGHMARNQLLVFARKPAPIQASLPIYPSTTGLSAMDYRIVDPYFGFPGAEAWNSEQLVRLPDTHLCYEPRDQTIVPEPEPAVRRNGHVTFGSFNNPAKIDEATVAVWSKLLRQLPGAKLMLKWRGMDEFGPGWFLPRFVRHGAAPEQLIFVGWARDAYSTYHSVDICLDPLRYNGGTTSCDALWMGVPVVTRCGDSPVARYGLCFLTNIGLPELIACDDERYVRIALDLARDVERLAALRNGLRPRFAASPLMDGPKYTRHLEDACREMWRRWCISS